MNFGKFFLKKGLKRHLIRQKIKIRIPLKNKNTSGKISEDSLYKCNIVVNKNMVPNDKKNPTITSGIRIGTPSITSRGFKSNEIFIISNWICDIINNEKNNKLLKILDKMVAKTESFDLDTLYIAEIKDVFPTSSIPL